jgi:glutamyl-tRNA reductase
MITAPMVLEAMKQRSNRPMFLIDLAVPRNIEENVGDLENVYLYDVDDFSAIVNQNLKKRRKELHLAELIVENESKQFNEMMSGNGFDPLIEQLTHKAETIARQELEKTLKKIPAATAEQTEALSRLVQSIARKIIHDPVLEIKLQAKADRNDESLVHMIRRLFRL